LDVSEAKDEAAMILQVKNLGFSYSDKRKIFSDVSFDIKQGEIMSILGPNGSGKSTLLNCIANLYTPTKGQILLEGKPVSSISLNEFSKKIGYVPQVHIPAYAYSVRDFVVMGRSPYIGMFSKPGKEDYAIADKCLRDLGISHIAHRPYTEISGGERQQATIARVVAQQPKLILMDEPTSHLDYGNQIRTIKLIKRLSSQGYGIIMTTHIPDHVILLGGKVGILNNKGNMVVGTSEEVMNEKILREIYRTELSLVYIEKINRVACVSNAL
jgi:iron complex transport system ATP-binding protein